jgi:protein CpxP
MNSKKKWLTAAAVMALSTSIAFAAPHEGKFGGHGRRGQMFGKRMAEKLNLSDAQKQQIKDIRKASYDANKPFFDGARDLRKQFHAAKEANDTAKIESLKPQMESQRAQFKQIREAEMTKILNVLTADQRAQFEALKAERKARRENRTNS